MALGRLKKARTALTSTPKAVKTFGKTLVSEGKKDIARKGSPAQRFSDAPLGQYYLPKTAQKALSFAAPSPRKVARDTSNVVRRPSAGTAAAAGGNVLSIATLPMLGVGAAKAGAASTRVTPRVARMLRGGEAGGVSKFPMRGSMVDRVRAQVFNKIRSAGAGGENRTQFLNRRITEIQNEIKQIDAAERVKAPTSLRNLSNIREKAGIPKGKALPRGLKAGEEGWVRMRPSLSNRITHVEMGPGKFAEHAGKGFYKMELGLSNKPGTMDVRWLKRHGDVKMSDVKGGMEAVRRNFAAKGFTKVEYEPMSESRTRLFQRTAAKMGVPATAKPPVNIPRRDLGKGVLDRALAGIRQGEEGFLRLPGKGEGGDAAREVVRRANLRATRSVLKHNIGTAKQFLSMETTSNLGHLEALVKNAPQVGSKSLRITGMETHLPAKTVGHLVKKEKAARAAMRKMGMNPGTVVRQGGSMIEIEGRMPMTAALQRLAKTDNPVFDAASMKKMGSQARARVSADFWKGFKPMKMGKGFGKRSPRN